MGSEGTIKAWLSGSNVKQGIRYYKLLFEALLRSKIAYLDDLQIDRVYTETLETSADASDCQMIHDSSDHTRMPQSSDDASGHPAGDAAQYATSSTGDPSNSNSTDSDSTWLSEQLTVLRIEQTADNLEKVVNHPTMTVPPPLIGGMATRMDSFIEMVDLLLNMIHFQRTGNFEGFPETIHQFLPWCFGLNRHNYARNMSYYYVDMRDLKNRNPDAYQFLCDGGFTGSITGERHTKIPMDQIIEMTVNRFSKETGGLSGNTENAGASQRWMRINHYLAALKQHLVERTKGTKTNHVELGSKRMQQDEDAVARTLAYQ